MPRYRPQLALTILLVAAALLYAVFIGRTSFRVDGHQYFTLIDDAMISMRYAQHLAQGHGLVWNIGDQPIQGFTNPGWLLLMAVLHMAGLPGEGISLAVMTLSAGILLGNACVVHGISLEVAPNSHMAPLVAAGVTAFYFPLVFWSLRGMEVGLLVLLLNLAALLAMRDISGKTEAAHGLGMLLAAALLVRLDAIVQAAIILVYFALRKPFKRRQAFFSVLFVAATLTLILFFQRAYFGDFLPNTYYQKLAGGLLEARLKHGVLVFIQYALRDVGIPCVVAAVGIWRFRDFRSHGALLLAALFVVQCLYSIWVGGDYAEPEVASANRFITQGVPALIILFSLVVERALIGRSWAGIRVPPSWMTSLMAGVGTLALMSGVPWYRWAADNAPLLQSDIRRARAGLAIAAHTSPYATIAVHAAGQIPYYSQRTTIDLLGLNDPVITHGPRRTSFYPGHDKWNYDYSIGRLLPDLIADNWIRLPDYMRQRSDYRKLENGMYVHNGTTLVDEVGLQDAFP